MLSGELDGLVSDFEGIAKVGYTTGMSIVSLICNVSRTSEILERVCGSVLDHLYSFLYHCPQVFRVLGREGINVKMMSQGASKTNISLIVSDSEGQRAVEAIHDEFFGAHVAALAPALANGKID